MFRSRRLACSFCGRTEEEAQKLVAGPKIFICERCAAEVIRIMDDSGRVGPTLPAPRAGLLRRIVRRVISPATRRPQSPELHAATP